MNFPQMHSAESAAKMRCPLRDPSSAEPNCIASACMLWKCTGYEGPIVWIVPPSNGQPGEGGFSHVYGPNEALNLDEVTELGGCALRASS